MMTRYVKVLDGEMLGEYRADPPNVDQSELAEGKPRWLPIALVDPAFDPETQVRTGPAWEVDTDEVREVYTIRDMTIDERRVVAIAALKQRRWEVEIGGVEVEIGGETVTISTARGDDRLNLHIMMTLIGAGQRPDGATFNFADGVPRSVSNADMLVAIGAALAKVQAAFDREAEVTALIEAAEDGGDMDAAVAEIETGWPE